MSDASYKSVTKMSKVYEELVGKGTMSRPALPVVPKSCIGAAEHIIKKDEGDFSVMAKFGVDDKGKVAELDISDTRDVHLSPKLMTASDYPFKSLPTIGQGIVCFKRPSAPDREKEYRMHFGAVVAECPDGSVVLSNVMESVGVPVEDTKLGSLESALLGEPKNLIRIYNYKEFFANNNLVGDGGSAEEWVIGVLYSKNKPAPT
jgi:hypothetical protein